MSKDGLSARSAFVLVCLCGACLVIGIFFGAFISRPKASAKPESISVDRTNYTSVKLKDGHEIIITTFPNPQGVQFYLPTLIAPDLTVGIGLEDSILENPEKYDSRGVGIEKAISLFAAIRDDVPEVTDIHASNTELFLEFGMDFISRKQELIDSAIQSICNHYDWELA